MQRDRQSSVGILRNNLIALAIELTQGTKIKLAFYHYRPGGTDLYSDRTWDVREFIAGARAQDSIIRAMAALACGQTSECLALLRQGFSEKVNQIKEHEGNVRMQCSHLLNPWYMKNQAIKFETPLNATETFAKRESLTDHQMITFGLLGMIDWENIGGSSPVRVKAVCSICDQSLPIHVDMAMKAMETARQAQQGKELSQKQTQGILKKWLWEMQAFGFDAGAVALLTGLKPMTPQERTQVLIKEGGFDAVLMKLLNAQDSIQENALRLIEGICGKDLEELELLDPRANSNGLKGSLEEQKSLRLFILLWTFVDVILFSRDINNFFEAREALLSLSEDVKAQDFEGKILLQESIKEAIEILIKRIDGAQEIHCCP